LGQSVLGDGITVDEQGQGPSMPSGLAALLDDISVIAKLAAASIDDVGAAAGRAGAKAAGVVIDDTAVTPQYVTGFTPDRELPIIWRIAKGSLFNKMVIILPVALLLSVFLPAAITPLLMIGGAYLCFEGAEKVIEKLMPHAEESLAEEVAELNSAEHEENMVKGAVRTDFILSAEIMAIALNEVKAMGESSVWLEAATLALVALVITVGVYGVVGLIVKMDDIGLRLAKTGSGGSQALGRGLVNAMPKLLAALSIIGTAAMMWVGGQIILHGLHIHANELVGVTGGVAGWITDAVLSGIFGLILGGIIAFAVHQVMKMRGKAH
jgi:uncharacterized protein